MRTRHRNMDTLFPNSDFSQPVRDRDPFQSKLLPYRRRNVEEGINTERNVGCVGKTVNNLAIESSSCSSYIQVIRGMDQRGELLVLSYQQRIPGHRRLENVSSQEFG